MNKILTLALLLGSCGSLLAESIPNATEITLATPEDTSRLAALNMYWNDLSRTVQEGDHVGYEALYHEVAVVVFGVGENKSSRSISKAMVGWKQGFQDTKTGKVKSNVKFRFSQRINNEDSAHETGIFSYGSSSDGKTAEPSYIHFEMLLVKRSGKWYGVMEYQKSKATEAEWAALNEH